MKKTPIFVTATAAKGRLYELLRAAQATNPVIITFRGEPVARLVPYKKEEQT
jgi:prevent-host-death family protein